MSTQPKITLLHRIDHIKGDWWLWECNAYFPDGTQQEGTVEADSGGHNIEKDTFEET